MSEMRVTRQLEPRPRQSAPPYPIAKVNPGELLRPSNGDKQTKVA